LTSDFRFQIPDFLFSVYPFLFLKYLSRFKDKRRCTTFTAVDEGKREINPIFEVSVQILGISDHGPPYQQNFEQKRFCSEGYTGCISPLKYSRLDRTVLK
jgi:hypothetical protein